MPPKLHEPDALAPARPACTCTSGVKCQVCLDWEHWQRVSDADDAAFDALPVVVIDARIATLHDHIQRQKKSIQTLRRRVKDLRHAELTLAAKIEAVAKDEAVLRRLQAQAEGG